MYVSVCIFLCVKVYVCVCVYVHVCVCERLLSLHRSPHRCPLFLRGLIKHTQDPESRCGTDTPCRRCFLLPLALDGELSVSIPHSRERRWAKRAPGGRLCLGSGSSGLLPGPQCILLRSPLRNVDEGVHLWPLVHPFYLAPLPFPLPGITHSSHQAPWAPRAIVRGACCCGRGTCVTGGS